ncbi:MAG: hypothetical protein JW725_03525 [Candidatus Babeliaceae bacterium]|nr:hypothetical protein [Candidatus Babeliaceae bacterium]
MRFDNLSIADLLKYFYTGFWFYLIGEKTKFPLISRIASLDSTFEKSVAIFFIGALTYFLYRTFVYPILLARTNDWFFSGNIRNIIGKKYNIKTWEDKNDLYNNLENIYPQFDVDKSRIWNSSIHLLYIVAIIGLFGIIFGKAKGIDDFSVLNYCIGVVICFFAAWTSDSFLQKRIGRNFILNINDEIDSRIRTFLRSNNSK